MISQHFSKIAICAIMVFCVSCRGKKDFVITDEYVNKEKGIKQDERKNTPRLSENDRKHFAEKLDVSTSQITNDELYVSVKKMETTNTTNSAAVAKKIYAEVYRKKLRGEAIDMFEDKNIELFKDTGNLREGDLVFFRIGTDQIISHVGVYLKNNRFVSSLDSKAQIYELKSGKWKNSFVTAGRLKE
ncbi:MAG: hypothetical protein DI539_06440 [Flavobacterium psychrophilum]|nr:MAG: hypothetical protein DI539_06440 [Flavobacterium psychrophilum]